MSDGRFSSEKGFHHIINACKKIKKNVLIVGAKWDETYMNSLKDLWVDAWIVGQVTQDVLSNYLRGADVYVCAAENERNNLALIEGIACGCKPISSPGNRGNEWFPGISIVDPKDEDALAETIKTVDSIDNFTCPSYRIPSWTEIVKMILK